MTGKFVVMLRRLALGAAPLMLIWGLATAPARAQDSAAPVSAQAQANEKFSEGNIQQLVAPIALYPDPLLSQVLMASTYPLEVVEAARWSQANSSVKGTALEDAMQAQSWDPSVKALTAVPQTLLMMSDKLDWTQQLGNAFLPARIMNSLSTSSVARRRPVAQPSARIVFAALGLLALGSTAQAADKPPLAPDTVAPFSTDSAISATIEFGLSTLAADIDRDIPRRLAIIDERVRCVHRRVLFFRVNANCDIYGFVDRSGPVSLYGRGDHVYGAVPIYGALEGQGANRFTARIHGETEASATVEAEARPELSRDWSLELNFSDGFRWSEPPVMHVMGREIPLSKYAEPRIREELAVVRGRALAAARRLDLHDKAATAWHHAFQPVQLSDNPEVWLQLTPQGAAFAGVRADGKVLRGSLELSGSAETVIGPQPMAVPVTALPPLGREVSEPGAFDVILPVRIGYEVIKDKISQAVAAIPPAAGLSVRDVEVYPSSGKLVVGLRIAKASDSDPNAGQWTYLAGSLQVDAGGHAMRLSDLAAATDDEGVAALVAPIVSQLRDQISIEYGVAYDNLLNAANARLNRPLKGGYRMEGHLTSARLEKLYLPADGVVIALRASGDLKILYGM